MVARKTSDIRKRRHRYRRRREQRSVEHFKKKLQEEGLFADKQVVYRNTPGKKISDALVTLVEPYKDDAVTEGAYRTLLSLGTLAWNLTLVAESEREAVLAECIASCPQDNQGMARDLIGDLMVRKQALMSDIKRYIVSFELRTINDRYHINVVSTE